jgi:hypothetical protein
LIELFLSQPDPVTGIQLHHGFLATVLDHVVAPENAVVVHQKSTASRAQPVVHYGGKSAKSLVKVGLLFRLLPKRG